MKIQSDGLCVSLNDISLESKSKDEVNRAAVKLIFSLTPSSDSMDPAIFN
jgi:hypothetical protein